VEPGIGGLKRVDASRLASSLSGTGEIGFSPFGKGLLPFGETLHGQRAAEEIGEFGFVLRRSGCPQRQVP